MAFPVVAARATGRTTNTNTTTHAITLPSGIVAGNLLVVVFSTDGNPTVTAQQAGWTKLNQASNGTVVTGAIFWKVATGSDALTLTTTVAEASSHASFRITNGGTPTATSAFATSTNSNPPAHTPPTGLRDYLWIATRSADSTNVASAAPASYANLQTLAATGTNGASTNTAERSLNATSTDPGTFTSTSIAWVSWTIAVPPANATAIPVLVASTESVGLPTVVIPQTRVMAAVAATSTVATPTLATHYPALVASTAAVATPAPAKTTTVPALVSSTTTVATPASLRLTVTTVAVASTASVALPTVIGSQARSMALVASTSTVAPPTVATHYPVTIPSTATVASPTVATHYPATIPSTATVATPTVVVWLRPVTIVNQPAARTTSASLAPSTTLLPSAGNDRFFPPVATVNLRSTHLPELVASTAVVEQPVVQPGGITTVPEMVASTASVGEIASVDTITLYRYPRVVSRVLAPSESLTPSTGLVPAAGLSRVYLPTVWRGDPQALSVDTVSSTASVGTPTATPTVFPRALTRTLTPSPDLAPSTSLVPTVAGLSVVFPLSGSGIATVRPMLVSGLYPSDNLYPSEQLYPSGSGVSAPSVHLGVVQLAPTTIPSGSAVHAPTLSGSGVNVVPIIFMDAVASTAAAAEPTVFVAPTGVEMEFLDTEESVELPNIVLQGETLLAIELVAPSSAIAWPTVVAGPTQVHPEVVASVPAVQLPTVVGLQIRVPQLVASAAAVGLPRLRGAEPPRDPYTDGPSASVPTVSSGPGAGAPVLVTGGFRAGAPVPV